MNQGMKRRIAYLFVYGTLRAAAGHPMQRHLRQHAHWLGAGQVAGRLYDLGRYPGLVPDTRAGLVQGDVYRLRYARTLLNILDHYEECAARMPQPREYRREPVQIQWKHRRLWAWVYVFNRPVAGLPAVRGGDYLAGLHTAQGRTGRLSAFPMRAASRRNCGG